MLLSFECSVEKEGGTRLGSKLLLCLTICSPSASVNKYLQPFTFLYCVGLGTCGELLVVMSRTKLAAALQKVHASGYIV